MFSIRKRKKFRFRATKIFSARDSCGKISCRYVEAASIFRHNRWLRFNLQLDGGECAVNFKGILDGLAIDLLVY
jgi:hypothetical protein